MKYNAFSITFNSIHLPRIPEDKIVWDEIGNEGVTLIESLYNTFHNDMNSTRTPSYRARSLEGSLFVFCIPEGLVMLKCDPDSETRDASLRGFLLRKDESLRTAWKLVRWQTLFLCAGGWNDVGKVSYTPDYINKSAAAKQFDDEYQKKLIKVGFDMMAAPVPYSFAMTNYLLNMLPLKFSGGNYVAFSGNQFEVSENDIVIDEQYLRSKICELKHKQWWINQCRMFKASRKQLSEILLEQEEKIIYECQIKAVKASLKSKLSAFQSDDIWCVRIKYSEMTYTEPIDPPVNYRLLNGSIQFEVLEMAINKIVRHSIDYFREINKIKEDEMQKRQLEMQRQRVMIDPRKEKSDRSLFGKSKKKNGE